MTEDSCPEVHLSQGHLLPGFGKDNDEKCSLSIDVGLVVIIAFTTGIL